MTTPCMLLGNRRVFRIRNNTQKYNELVEAATLPWKGRPERRSRGTTSKGTSERSAQILFFKFSHPFLLFNQASLDMVNVWRVVD